MTDDSLGLPARPHPVTDTVQAPLLMAAIGHGVRTPLHLLVGFLELLSITELDDDQLRLMEQVMDGADALVTVMDRIMLLLRLAGGSQPQHPAPVALDELLERVLCDAGPRPGHRGVTLVPVLAPSLHVRALTDPQLLQHLLSTLIDGALDRRTDHAGATITVTAAVLDAGAGPYLRVDVDEPDDVTSGAAPVDLVDTALIEALTAHLGGTVLRGRADPGADRVISVSVPVTLQTQAGPIERPLPAGTSREPAQPLACLRVLLAEDNEINRMLAQRQLKKLGHVLTTVEDGVAAVQAVALGGIDVVLMDCHMPDLDGLEATRRIRAAEARHGDGRRIPIIAVTADALAENREACLAAGMDEFLSKPVDLAQLDEALNRWTATGGASPPPGAISTPGPVPRQSTGSHREAVDHSVLARLLHQLDGDHAGVGALVDTYLTRLPAYRLRLRAASRQSAPGVLVSCARTLRTASDAVGAVELSQACAALEQRGAQVDAAVRASIVTGLLDSCDRTVAALARYRGPVGAAPGRD